MGWRTGKLLTVPWAEHPSPRSGAEEACRAAQNARSEGILVVVCGLRVYAVPLIESASRFHTPAKLATSTREGYQASKALKGEKQLHPD